MIISSWSIPHFSDMVSHVSVLRFGRWPGRWKPNLDVSLKMSEVSEKMFSTKSGFSYVFKILFVDAWFIKLGISQPLVR